MPRSVAELLNHATTRFGERSFLSIAGGQCTFAEFDARVRIAASLLLANGLQPGDRVAILLPRCPEEAVFLLATMVAGGLAVPIHGKLKDDQVAHVLADAEPRLVVTSPERTVALVDEQAVLSSHHVLLAASLQDAPDAADVAFGGKAGDASVLLYTSGSTGRAKGIVQTQENLLHGAEVVSKFLALTPEDHTLVLLSFSFDYGLNQLLTALLAGCRLTAADHLGVGELATLFERHRPTGLAGVPSLWHEVATGLASGALTAAHGASLRYLTNSGGALRREDTDVLRQSWPGVAIFAMYGLTEAFRSAFLPPAEFDEHPESFGYAIEGVELLLVSVDDGSVLEGPATGELVHAGGLVANGYWRRPDEDAARFRSDPREGRERERVVYSGDLVRRDEYGRHYFVARRDRMLKVHGHRVSPDEVAQAVAELVGIGACCVFGLDGGADGHRIVLCLAGDPEDRELLRLVQRRCRARLPSYMLPSIVRVFASLPYTANGKVDVPCLTAIVTTCTDDT